MKNIIPNSKEENKKFVKGDSIFESIENDIISYSRVKEMVTVYENTKIKENYRNNLAREEGLKKKDTMEELSRIQTKRKKLKIKHLIKKYC